jgi:hypothetical protein
MSSDDKNRFLSLVAKELTLQQCVKDQRAIVLGETEDERPLVFSKEKLKTHLLIQSPTQHGKTFLARHIVRELLAENATVYVDDPKGDLYHGLEEDCAGLGLGDRTILFDTSRTDRILAFNPLQPMGLRPEDHALWIVGSVKACWHQESMDETPQRLRWMFNALVPVIAAQGLFHDALTLLNYRSESRRREILSTTTNDLIREEWEAYENLTVSRRREETASTFGWLYPFCTNPTIQAIVGRRPESVDIGRALREGSIFLSYIPRFRPLQPDQVNFLRTLFLQSLLAHAFHVPLGVRPPLYIVLDEAEHVLERDPGVIETILNEGATLGIHLILIFHTLAQVMKERPSLLASVLSNCRTKILGGHLTQQDLPMLTEEFFIEEWHPYIVKDVIESLEIEPVETTRDTIAFSEGGQEAVAKQAGRALGQALQEATTETESEGESDGWTDSSLVSETITRFPDGDDPSTGETAGSGSSYVAVSTMTRGIAKTIGSVFSEAVSSSTSKSAGTTWNKAITRGPFHELLKRIKVSSREFLSLQEFLTTKLQRLKGLPRAHWAIKTIEGRAVFFKAAFVKSLDKGSDLLADFRKLVFKKSWYAEIPEKPGPSSMPSEEIVHPAEEAYLCGEVVVRKPKRRNGNG